MPEPMPTKAPVKPHQTAADGGKTVNLNRWLGSLRYVDDGTSPDETPDWVLAGETEPTGETQPPDYGDTAKPRNDGDEHQQQHAQDAGGQQQHHCHGPGGLHDDPR